MTQDSGFSGGNQAQIIQVLVGAWLKEDQWEVVNFPFPQTQWALLATDTAGRTVVVAQPEDVNEFLLIQGDAVLNESTRERARQISDAELDVILWELRRELIQTDLEFRIAGEPLALIQMSQRIFFDHRNELSKDVFFQRVSKVRRGILLVRWLMERWIP
ncbi:MAG: DUF2299 family protein [Dehalococcoidia bacterium]